MNDFFSSYADLETPFKAPMTRKISLRKTGFSAHLPPSLLLYNSVHLEPSSGQSSQKKEMEKHNRDFAYSLQIPRAPFSGTFDESQPCLGVLGSCPDPVLVVQPLACVPSQLGFR